MAAAAAAGNQVLDRLVAVQTFLGSSTKLGVAAFQSAKIAQHKALLALIRETPLCLATATATNKAFDQELWTEDELILLTTAVMNRVTTSTIALPITQGLRRGLQNYTAVANYFTEQQWVALRNAQVSDGAKMQMVVDHLVAMGLRCPTENTVQAATCLYLLVADPEKARTMHSSMKLFTFQAMKGKLKKQALQAIPSDAEYIMHLPMDPADCKATYPAVWAAAFKVEECPIMCPISAVDLSHGALSIPMRVTRHVDAARMPVQVELPLSQATQQMATNMMMQMQNMQKVQDMTLQFLHNMSRGTPHLAIELPLPSPTVDVGLQLALPPPSTPAAMRRLGSRVGSIGSSVSTNDSQLEAEVEAEVAPTGPLPTEVPLQTEPPKGKKRSVEDSTAIILSAMQLKTEAKAKSKAAAKPVAKCKAKAKAKGKAKPVSASTPAKTKTEAGAASTIKAEPSAKKTKTETDAGPRKMPHYGIERTRDQVLCRTGLKGPGETKAFTFKASGGEAKAVAKAKIWVAAETKKLA
jgi:hypothetical protein